METWPRPLSSGWQRKAPHVTSKPHSELRALPSPPVRSHPLRNSGGLKVEFLSGRRCSISVWETLFLLPSPASVPGAVQTFPPACFSSGILEWSTYSLERIFFLYHPSLLYKQQIALLLPFKFRESGSHTADAWCWGRAALPQTHWEAKQPQPAPLSLSRGCRAWVLLL